MSFIDLGNGKIKKKYKKDDKNKLHVVTENFIEFLEKSSERNCDCKDGKYSMMEFVKKSGKVDHRIVCSICKNKYYKYHDMSFLALIEGMKGSGKTTFALTIADLIYRIDNHREILVWQCPDDLIDSLYEVNWCSRYNTVCERALGEMEWSNSTPKYYVKKGKNQVQASFQKNEEKHRICSFDDKKKVDDCKTCKHYKDGLRHFRKITKLTEITYNSVVVMDETVITANAKLALTKAMRNWDKFLMVARHKRCILLCLFQRPEILKSMRETKDMSLYKRLAEERILEEKKDKFLKEHAYTLQKLGKGQTIIRSQYYYFDKTGLIETKAPEWYNERISMSYENEEDFIDDKAEDRKSLNFARELAQWLIDHHIVIESSDEKVGAKGILRGEFPEATNKDLQWAIEQYFAIRMRNGGNDEDNPQNGGIVNEALSSDDIMQELATVDTSISELEREAYHLYVQGRSMRDFNEDPYHFTHQDMSRIVQKVGFAYEQLLADYKKKLNTGEKTTETTERRAKKESWESDGYAVRTVGSGGMRGEVPTPDLLEITNSGRIRTVQVKERDFTNKEHVTFQPTTIDTELNAMNRIRAIAQETSIKCPHCLEVIKGKQVGGILQPDGAYLYIANKGNSTEPIFKERIKIEDNKKTLKVYWNEKKVIREEPILNDYKNPILIEFLKSDKKLLPKNVIIEEIREKVEEKEEKTINSLEKISPKDEQEINEMLDLDNLIKEAESVKENE